jgi:hypothetical protein
MRQAVFVEFTPQHPQEIDLHAGTQPMPADDARRWLDDQFLAHDCEPLRPTGKVLTADKVLALATAAGARQFERDAAWAQDFARATLGALGRPVVTVDVAGGSVRPH